MLCFVFVSQYGFGVRGQGEEWKQRKQLEDGQLSR